MKIAVQVIVEMTPEQASTYCHENSVERHEIRDDIRTYIRTALQDSPAFGDGAADVSVRGT